MQRSEKTWRICTIILGGLLVAILYHGIVGTIIGAGYPSNSFLFRPELIFSDFYDIFSPIQNGSPLGSKTSVYFPFAYVPLYPLTGMYPTNALRVTLLACSTGIFMFLWLHLSFLSMWRRVAAAAIIGFTSYPFIFCVHRGNLELILLMFTMGFASLITRNKYNMAGVLLACATAMKLYPGALGMVLLQRRQYKAALITAILTVVLTVAAAAAFPGGASATAKTLFGNLAFFNERYVLSAETIPFSTSYFSLIKIFAALTGRDVSLVAQQTHSYYMVFCLLTLAVISIYVILRERTLWKQACLASLMMILLPEVTFDYKLIHLLIPIAMFIAAPAAVATHDRLYAIGFGLLMIPKAYAPIGSETTLGVILNPAIMTIMMVHIIWTGCRRSSVDAFAADDAASFVGGDDGREVRR